MSGLDPPDTWEITRFVCQWMCTKDVLLFPEQHLFHCGCTAYLVWLYLWISSVSFCYFFCYFLGEGIDCSDCRTQNAHTYNKTVATLVLVDLSVLITDKLQFQEPCPLPINPFRTHRKGNGLTRVCTVLISGALCFCCCWGSEKVNIVSGVLDRRDRERNINQRGLSAMDPPAIPRSQANQCRMVANERLMHTRVIGWIDVRSAACSLVKERRKWPLSLRAAASFKLRSLAAQSLCNLHHFEGKTHSPHFQHGR